MEHTLLPNQFYKFLIALLVFAQANVLAQPAIQWDRTLGGPDYSYLSSSQQTADGGYILGGFSPSGTSSDKTDSGVGASDYWIVKLSANGVKEWDQAFGGLGYDDLVSVRQTTDGGYILAGNSSSDAGGDKSENYRGGSTDGIRNFDYWIVKISADGTKEWDKTLGGTGEEELYSISQTTDGGYILGGISASGAGVDKTDPNMFSLDFWIVKLAADGEKQWDKTYGSSNATEFNCIVKQTSDGSYIFGGTTTEELSNREADYKVAKLSPDGILIWEKTFGGTGRDYLTSIEVTKDDGYIIGGYSNTNAEGDKSEGAQLGPDSDERIRDYWVLRLTSDGLKVWDRTIGGLMYDAGGYYSGESFLSSIYHTFDGGYILGGYSKAQKGRSKTENNKGEDDYWIVKINAKGDKIWDKTLGGNGLDRLQSIFQTVDGGYFLGGYSYSNKSSDKTENLTGQFYDFWIVKLAPEPLPVTLTYFIVQKENSSALLTWSTSSETHNDRFEVQRSFNGINWHLIATVKSSGDVNKPANYMVVDNKPELGIDNLYRLKMIDTDGTFAYSKIKSFHFEQDASLNIFPNPTAETLTIKMDDWQNVKSVELLNSRSGVVYHSGEKPVQSVNIRGLPAGLYFLRVNMTNSNSYLRKFFIER